MSVQKNFVIKNGLEVNSDLIYADKDSNNVGIGTTVVTEKLFVNGGIGATSLIITGVSTFTQISAGGTTGSNNYFLTSTGTGITWTSATSRGSSVFTATVSQTTFSASYTVGFVDVYVNGVRLTSTEYTATDGTTVVLDDACFGGETVEIISYSTVPSGISTAISGITIQEEGVNIGTPASMNSINFVGGNVTATATGVGATITVVDYDYWIKNNTGIHTTSNVGIGTTTASSALTVTGNGSFTGIVTATGGFISAASTTPITISLVGDQLTFTASGIGSTTFTLS